MILTGGLLLCQGTIFSVMFVYCIMFSFLNSAGRPRINIDLENVQFLRSLRFSWERIANILDISRSTLVRRVNNEGTFQTFADISDARLDNLMRSNCNIHTGMIGHLARQGVRVQRGCLRGSIHRVDPLNTILRRSVAIRRRVYHSDGPNST